MTRAQMEAKIESLKTAKGGWTKASLASLGVAWPPPAGWKEKLLDKAGCSHAWYMRDAGIQCTKCLLVWKNNEDNNLSNV
jgi:hypothetical protein